MMIDKRLIGTVPQSKKTIAANVLFQWGALCANIVLMAALARLLQRLYLGAADAAAWARLGGVVAGLCPRLACSGDSDDPCCVRGACVRGSRQRVRLGQVLSAGVCVCE